ncbi:MAG: DNA modification methylase [Patescibacteria group bacterium]|nr:DNA modification methylase [Patescibacteria group bacterium]
MKNLNLVWRAEKRRVTDLKAWSKNPRKISKKALEGLKDRIRQRGFHDVVKIDLDGTILSGNQRKKALVELAIDEVTVLVPDRKLSDEERNKVALESNISDGEWNIAELKSFDIGTLSDVGFDIAELEESWGERHEVRDDNWDEQAEIKKAKKTSVKPGDMFELGKHRLVCGDSTDMTTVRKLMNGAKADLVDVDPPFNIGLSYDRGVGNRKHYGGNVDDHKSEEEYNAFVVSLVGNALAASKPDAHFIFWTDERWVWLFQTTYRKFSIDSKRLLVWLKNNASPTPRSAFGKMTEFAVYGTTGSPYLNDTVTDLHEIMNKEVTTGNSVHDEVLDMMNVMLVRRLPSTEYEHPTQKNPTLHEKALRRCTQPNDVVLDLTAGSGSIMSACEQLGRSAYMVEQDPVFCQVILNRYKKLTGHNPKKIHEEK